MPVEIRCPECGSPKTMAVPDSSAFMCYTCKHEFTPEKVIFPLRIFLSYGHDVNEELVRRIKADLEQRGHDVWFDKTEIKFGDEWRRIATVKVGNLDSGKELLALRAAPSFDFTKGQFENGATDIIQFLRTAQLAKE